MGGEWAEKEKTRKYQWNLDLRDLCCSIRSVLYEFQSFSVKKKSHLSFG